MSAQQKASRVRVEGRVQRVGYRRFILDAAQELGLSGFVKNERDGSVTVFAQGGEQQLNRFLERVRAPPHPISVKSFVERPVEPKPEVKFFEVKFGSLAEEFQEGFGAMEREFRDYRDEFRDYRSEFRSFRDEFREFAERTDKNFQLLMEKYGEISQRLTEVLETLRRESMETRKELIRAVDTLSDLVRRFMEGRKEQTP